MLTVESPAERPGSRHEAARPSLVGFLHRVPFAVDAHRLGFATGVREDYKLRQMHCDALDVPVVILDNDFRDADPDRYIERLESLTPTPALGVIADVETATAARKAAEMGRELRAATGVDPVVVPKSKAALDALPTDVIAGYPNSPNYSGTHASEYTRSADWAGRRVHILGGAPQRQLATIEDLTGYNASSNTSLDAFGGGREFDPDAVANIVAVDWNGCQRVAYKGERWTETAPHWQAADHLTIRETVRRSLTSAKRFWMHAGLWPETTPKDVYGAVYTPPKEPRDYVCAGCGHDLHGEGDIEVVHENLEGVKRAYCSELCRERLRFRDGVADTP